MFILVYDTLVKKKKNYALGMLRFKYFFKNKNDGKCKLPTFHLCNI